MLGPIGPALTSGPVAWRDGRLTLTAEARAAQTDVSSASELNGRGGVGAAKAVKGKQVMRRRMRRRGDTVVSLE